MILVQKNSSGFSKNVRNFTYNEFENCSGICKKMFKNLRNVHNWNKMFKIWKTAYFKNNLWIWEDVCKYIKIIEKK